MGGLNRRLAYQQQPPFTTPSALNVRPDGSLEGRARGGLRPGLDFAFDDALRFGEPVRMMSNVRKTATNTFDTFLDLFRDDEFGEFWREPRGDNTEKEFTHWMARGLPALVKPQNATTYLAVSDTEKHEERMPRGAVYVEDLGIDDVTNYSIEIDVVPGFANGNLGFARF